MINTLVYQLQESPTWLAWPSLGYHSKKKLNMAYPLLDPTENSSVIQSLALAV